MFRKQVAVALGMAAGIAVLAAGWTFVVGRVGYLIAPVGRAFGLGLTFYPTIAAYVWLVLRWA